MSKPTLREMIEAQTRAGRGHGHYNGEHYRAALNTLRRLDPDDPANIERVIKALIEHRFSSVMHDKARAILTAIIEGEP